VGVGKSIKDWWLVAACLSEREGKSHPPGVAVRSGTRSAVGGGATLIPRESPKGAREKPDVWINKTDLRRAEEEMKRRSNEGGRDLTRISCGIQITEERDKRGKYSL